VDFSGFMDDIISFVQNYPVIAIVLALGLLFFMYRKPKVFFWMLLFCLLLAGLLYLITNISGLGKEHKEKLIDEEEQQVDSDR
jgi:hypothetical protein